MHVGCQVQADASKLTLKSGVVRVTWPSWNFGAQNNISGTA